MNSTRSVVGESTGHIERIQNAIRDAHVDGWLFYNFRGSDPIATRILKLSPQGIGTRRWYYFIPASGEPVKLVHRIESGALDRLPGQKLIYLSWQEQHSLLSRLLSGARRIAMQYSPHNAIPYISRVDAGTIELIRSFGVEVVSSGDLVQIFEAVWTPEQLNSHLYAAEKLRVTLDQAFAKVKSDLHEGTSITEYDLQQFILACFEEENLTGDPPIVAANAHGADPHFAPRPEPEYAVPLKQGDFLLIDLWAKRKEDGSVYADTTWVGFIGEVVPQKYQMIFDIVKRARDTAVEFVQRSVKDHTPLAGWQVDDVARKVISDAGYGASFIHRTGHSIGEEDHGNGANMDNLETRDERKIIPHTCFSIEPGVYLEGEFGVRLEVNVYVSDHEAIVADPLVQREIIPILRR
ncbi:MAG: M24 family metallopeptidase [Candidatus Tectomicrobia bacterium]|nr:M24 family metallopeptidase [Candidatus Tectomicrobia bacterium]